MMMLDIKTGADRQMMREAAKLAWQEEFYKNAPKTGLESRQQQRARLRAADKQVKRQPICPPLRPIHLSLGKRDWRSEAGAASKPTNVRQAIKRG